MSTKPRLIVICGSSRFCQEMAVCGWFLERDEGAIADSPCRDCKSVIS